MLKTKDKMNFPTSTIQKEFQDPRFLDSQSKYP